jgi:DNA-binding IclR family transcriptional regulator
MLGGSVVPVKKKTENIETEAETEPRQPAYSAPALEKGLDILELLAKQQAGLSRREIAERLGRSVGEVFRMVETLTRRSYIVQQEEIYVLGMRLFELAHEFPPMQRLIKEAMPRMETLSQTVDQSCHLSVLNGSRQLVIAQVDTPSGVGFGVKIGATLDLLQSASGQVLLAFAPDDDRLRIIESIEPNLSPAEKKTVHNTVAKVEKQGFAFIKSNQFSGVEAISFPILDLRGRAIAALTVPYVTRLDVRTGVPASEVLDILAQVTQDLNATLGSGSRRSGELGSILHARM